jgi:hypothetical protein
MAHVGDFSTVNQLSRNNEPPSQEDESFLHRALSSFFGKFLLYVFIIFLVNLALGIFFRLSNPLGMLISISGLIGCLGHLVNFWDWYVNYEDVIVPRAWAICALLASLMFFHPF